MKQINIAISVVLLLGAASCSQEEVVNPTDGDGNVTFTVSLPGDMSTRSFADGYSAKNLKVAVYNEDGTLVYEPAAATFNENSLETTVSLDLAQGVAYKIAFFAYNAEAGGYEFNAVDKTVTAKYDAMAGKYNTDVFDCFYTLYTTEKLSGPLNANVMLTRPVAQVNWGTSDLTSKAVTAESAYGEGAKNLFTKVTTTIPSKLDLLNGDAKEGTEVTVEFPYLDRPAADEVYPVKPETFKYLSMQYLLVSKDASTVDLTFDAANSQSASKPLKTLTVSNVPVQANFRTNIYGALLTSAVDITVDKDQGFDDDYIYPTEPIEISNNVELAAAIQNGGNYIIPEGTVLTMPDVTKTVELSKPVKLNVEGTMKLNGVGTTGSADWKDNIKNLSLLKVTSYVELTGSGTIEADGGDFMFDVKKNGHLDVDGVNIIYNCTENAANRAAVNVNYVADAVDNPVIIKNSTITSNCTALRHNNSSKITIENTCINVKLRSDGGNMWGAIESKGNLNLTNVKINSKARALEVDVNPDNNPFDATLKNCEFYADADRVLYISSAWVEGSKLTIDGGKYSCRNTTGTEYKSPIIFDNNKSGKKFDCNIISGEFVKQPWGFQSGIWPDWINDDPSVYLAPDSRWEEITPAATNPVYTWRVVK